MHPFLLHSTVSLATTPEEESPVFVTEAHGLDNLAGGIFQSSTDPFGLTDWGWGALTPGAASAGGKEYFEFQYLSRGVADGALANWYVSYEGALNGLEAAFILYANGSLETDIDSAQIGAVSAVAFPETHRVCVDRGVGRVWAALNDGLWNGSAMADPATGTGGVAYNVANLSAPGTIVVYIDDAGNNEQARLALHEHQFLYAAPEGFGEFTVAGEYE